MVWVRVLVYLHIFPNSKHWEGLEAVLAHYQWVYVVSRSSFLKIFSNRRNQNPLEKLGFEGCGRKNTKGALEHLVVPECTNMQKEERKKEKRAGGHIERSQDPTWKSS